MSQHENLIKKAYSAFNKRDIDAALSTMHPDIQWPKAFEGSYAHGHEEIRAYWTRQWHEIDPNVAPVGLLDRDADTVEVKVHQLVKDREGKLLFDGTVYHVYTIENGLLKKMEIEQRKV